jgi:hypothetical protein
MAASLEDKLARLPAERRARVDARAALLIAEEMTLRDLRRALDRTQVHLARELGVKQETISRGIAHAAHYRASGGPSG